MQSLYVARRPERGTRGKDHSSREVNQKARLRRPQCKPDLPSHRCPQDLLVGGHVANRILLQIRCLHNPTGKIDHILSCFFTSLQRIDMFFKVALISRGHMFTSLYNDWGIDIPDSHYATFSPPEEHPSMTASVFG